MNDDPSEMRVLYARIDSPALQELSDQIMMYFRSKGLAKREFDRDTVKMHMTLINVRYAEESDEGDGSSEKKNRRSAHFDGRTVLDEFKDYDFGAQEVNEMHLSVMHGLGADGYYDSTAIVKF